MVETDYKRGKQMYSEKSKSKMNWAVIISDVRGYRPPNNHIRHCKTTTSAV